MVYLPHWIPPLHPLRQPAAPASPSSTTLTLAPSPLPSAQILSHTEFLPSPSQRSSSSISLNSPSPCSSSSSSTPSIIAQSNLSPASSEYSTPIMLPSPNLKSLLQSTNASSLSTSSPFFAISNEFVVVLCAKVLSKISKEQAARLREVEREYEQVLDNESSDVVISPTLLILKSTAKGGSREIRKGEMAMALRSALLVRAAAVATGEDMEGVEEGSGVENALYNREG